MKTISLVAVAVVAGTIFGGGLARADIPPPDACTSPGQPCQVAGPTYDQPGTCQTGTCSKGLPDGHGGVTTTTYACNLCVRGGGAGGATGTAGAAGAGAASGSSAGGAGGTSTGAGGQTGSLGPGPKKDPSRSSGCAVVGGRAGLDSTALLLLAVIFARRRRTNA